MKTNPEFTSLIDQVGFGLAVVLFEKRLTDDYFDDLRPEQIFLIAPHVLGNERLIKLLSARLKTVDRPINAWFSYYNDEPDRSLLKEIILSRIKSFTLPCEEWLRMRSLTSWRSLDELCLEMAQQNLTNFKNGKNIVDALQPRDESTEAVLEKMSAFAVTYDEWMFIMTRATKKSPLIEKGIAAIDKLEMTYDEWHKKVPDLKNDNDIYQKMYPLIMKKRQLTAKTFENFVTELGVVLLHMLYSANNSIFRSDVNKLLLKMKASASTISHWLSLANLAREHNFYSILRASLKKIEGLAVSTDDYYALYRVLRSGEKKGAYLKKLKATSPTPTFWITVISDQAKLEHRDPDILAAAKEGLLNAPPNSANWLDIYSDKNSSNTLKELMLVKIAQCFYTIERLCVLYEHSEKDEALLKIINEQIRCYRVPCPGWIKLKDSSRAWRVRKLLLSKIVESATKFQDWVHVLNDEDAQIPEIDKAKRQMALLAASLDDYLLVCENTDPASEEYKMTLGKIENLPLSLQEWRHVYNSATNTSLNMEPKNDTNPLALLAIEKMTQTSVATKKNQPLPKLAE